MGFHQAIHEKDEIKVAKVSKIELLSVWRCAAKLAELEGMPRTGERLRNDADWLSDQLEAGNRLVIEVVS